MAAILFTPTNQFPLKISPKIESLSLLERCSAMEELKQIHAQMIKTGLILKTIPVSRLLASCATSNYGSLTYAIRLFKAIPRPNTFMWNTVIRAHLKSNNPEDAILLYCQMLHSSKSAPSYNTYTFPFLLKACSARSSVEEAKQIHAHIIKIRLDSDVYTANSLLHVYAKSGNLASARMLFDRILHRDIVTWNSMIDGYGKTGIVEAARELFDQMPAKNIISWTSMITACTEGGMFQEALTLFQEMLSVGIEPDGAALVGVISACTQLGALDEGKWISTYIERNDVQVDPILGCSLVDMYSKCGDVEEALKIFKKMDRRSITAWTAMITGFAIHGRGQEALDLFAEMERTGVKPNQVTFTGLLTACSHAGLVDEGKSLFQQMEKKYAVSPSVEHYGCMVDLLGRAGMLRDAEELIEKMPIRPNAAIWGALLNACRIHKNFDMGRRVGKILIELDPDHGGRYIHLASIFAAEGHWNEAVKLRKMMKDRGVSKLPGCSSMVLKGVVHNFFAGDDSHPLTKEIYLEWDRISERLREEGYVPLTDDLLLDLEEDEKEKAIHHHSEKLAIALGLISTDTGTTIRIVKNLRVCEDCHLVTKLISRVYKREIIVRDRTRFHHFKDGNCSCRDYW